MTKLDESKVRLVRKKKFGFKTRSVASQPNTETKVEGVSKEVARKEFLWAEIKKQKVINLDGDKTNNQDLTLKEMENCVIIIIDHPGSLRMSKISNCLVLCGPSSGIIARMSRQPTSTLLHSKRPEEGGNSRDIHEET